MGSERQHARFTLVTGGSRALGVAFGSAPGALASPGRPHDLAIRLERNRWNGLVEPRVILRAHCPTQEGALRVLGEDEPYWERVRRELERDPAGVPGPSGPGAEPSDRRGEGFAGVAGDLLTSGEPALVAVADLPRRRRSLEELLAGLAPDGLAVASWSALERDPGIVTGVRHLIALDPPPGGIRDPLLRLAPLGHAAWGPPEVEFAIAAWTAELELRPALVDTWRALREAADSNGGSLRAALCGSGRYPRSPECCGRILRVLTELGLVVFEPPASCRVTDAGRTDLERSPAYRAYRDRLAAIANALGDEVADRAAVA